MNFPQVRKLVDHYGSVLLGTGNPPQQINPNIRVSISGDLILLSQIKRHLTWMCNQVSDGKMSETKMNRWLGFIQGCLFMAGILTIEQLKKDVLEAKDA